MSGLGDSSGGIYLEAGKVKSLFFLVESNSFYYVVDELLVPRTTA